MKKSPDPAAKPKWERWCRRCDHREDIFPGSPYEPGWDAPPRIGAWGKIASPICAYCGFTGPIWVVLIIDRDPLSGEYDSRWRIVRETDPDPDPDPEE